MNTAALRRLLEVREHRVEAAQVALEAARRTLTARENEVASLQTSLEQTLMTRMSEQRAFDQRAATGEVGLALIDAQQCEQYVSRLTQEATRIGEKIAKARKAVAAAQEQVAVARRALRHAMAKRDALAKLLREHETEAARIVARVEDEETEEIAARRESLA
ncbi:MAG: YscO family type III secretion system apparatus protein [Pseudomonadota bacterium]